MTDYTEVGDLERSLITLGVLRQQAAKLKWWQFIERQRVRVDLEVQQQLVYFLKTLPPHSCVWPTAWVESTKP